MNASSNVEIRSSISKDTSFQIYESWGYLLKNFLIIILVSITAWALVIVIRYGIDIINTFIFSFFKNNHATGGSKISLKTEIAFLLIFSTLLGSALIRGLLLRLPSWRASAGDGLDSSIQDYHSTYQETESFEDIKRYKKSTFRQALKRAFLTTLTIGGGGSGGIEAPMIPIGEALGAGWSKILKIAKPDDLRIYQMAGMSAAVTTLLDAPLTAALLAAEMVYSAKILYRPLMYSLIGSIVAFAMNNYFSTFPPLLSPSSISHIYSVQEYIEITAVALICSIFASLGITYLFRSIEFIMSPFNQLIKLLLGAFATGIIGFITWYFLGLEPNYVLGISEETIIQVMNPGENIILQSFSVLILLVLLKALATGFTLMAGGSAGRLVPAMYIGGLTGAAIYYFLTDIAGIATSASVSVYLVAGLASGLVAIRQIPLASVALVMEVFGAHYLPPAIVSCVLTYMMGHRWNIYKKLN